VPNAISGDALVSLLTAPTDPSTVGDVLVVDGLPAGDPTRWPAALERLATTPCVVVGRDGWEGASPDVLELVDLVVRDDADLASVVDTCATMPLASAALAVHLRAGHRTVSQGLVAESALYSTLQGGPEFARWRQATPVRDRPAPSGPAVVVERDGDELHIQLARPEVRNALGVQMRDGLLEALAIAEADDRLHITLTGQGPDFCSGGDLDEFGSAPDPASAHAIRLLRSIGAVLHGLRDRFSVHLHGACYGSGIELPAFAGHVVAHSDTTMALPELGLGLIPGAGGTVSLPARIGRHATAHLAFTRLPIDAPTALRLGLVDEIRP
jgi:hypothetical protein